MKKTFIVKLGSLLGDLRILRIIILFFLAVE